MSPAQYAEIPVTKSLRCVEVLDECLWKGILIEGIHKFVCSSMRSYCSTDPGAAVFDLNCHETLRQALQQGTNTYAEKESKHLQRSKNFRGTIEKFFKYGQHRQA